MREAAQPPVTVASAITSVAQRLSQSGVDRARAEAESLVRSVTGLSREAVLIRPEAPVSAEQVRRLEALAARRARREPLPYLLGRAEFYSLSFQVSSAAIVPRPETEILVEAALERGAPRRPRLAVDVGTGSGAVAVVLARHLPETRVVATDISLDALALARENCRRHHVQRRVSLLCADLLAGLREQADLIVANLPYIATGDFAGLQPEVRSFEPRSALDGGQDGLDLIRRLSVQLLDHLSGGGFAALEVGAGQASEVAKLLRVGRLSQVEVIADYAGIDRVVIGRRPG